MNPFQEPSCPAPAAEPAVPDVSRSALFRRSALDHHEGSLERGEVLDLGSSRSWALFLAAVVVLGIAAGVAALVRIDVTHEIRGSVHAEEGSASLAAERLARIGGHLEHARALAAAPSPQPAGALRGELDRALREWEALVRESRVRRARFLLPGRWREAVHPGETIRVLVGQDGESGLDGRIVAVDRGPSGALDVELIRPEEAEALLPGAPLRARLTLRGQPLLSVLIEGFGGR